ncbi:unnamed protein product [Candidula unifasciata]|uniref:Uncharacterized protein n=1 Tax=Candidula unifasciata TaxID=100452 RepID=A0A8S3YN62_9EUPU|nr:unnamed protein product [Candidula unifasciata]
MREDLQQAQKHNVELMKQNKKLKKEIQELKQNPMVEKFTEVKDHVENLKNKMYILSSVASGAAETIVELSQMCSSGKPMETSSNMTTACSLLHDSGDVSLTDATCSAPAVSESTLKKAFPDVIKHKRAHKEKHPLPTHCKQKVCPHFSKDDTAANSECTESWSFCNVVASLSPSSVCNCENTRVNYTEKRREQDTYTTKTTAQFETRKNTESAHSAHKDQMLEAWVAASRLHTKGSTLDNEMPFYNSPNSGSGDKPQSTCNAERVSQNSPEIAELRKSPATPNPQRKIGHQQENRPKSRSPSSRREESPVTIPFTGNVKSNKSLQKPTTSGFKRRPLSFHKIKLKKCDGLNNTANQHLNVKHWGLCSSAVCNKDKNNIESGFSKSASHKVGGQESAAKATFLTSVSTRISKSQKLKKGANKMCKNSLTGFPKTKLKTGQQKLAEQFPVFLNAEKQKLGNVLSMPADKSTFPLPSFKNTNETLSTKYETFTVDRLSNINLCSLSNKQVQLEGNLVHSEMLKDISPSEEDVHSKRHAQHTQLNDCEYSTVGTSQDVFDEENSIPSTLEYPSCIKADCHHHGDNVFQKRCLERLGDDVKHNELSVQTSNDYSNKWSTKNNGVSSTDLSKYNEFKNADTNIGGSENYHRSAVNCTLPDQQNLSSGTQRQINIPVERRDQNVVTDTHNDRNSMYCYTRAHSAVLKREKSGEGRDITRDVDIVCYSNGCKINTLMKTTKRRPHSVAGNRSKTNIFESEIKFKTINSNIKSCFVPINVSCKEGDKIHASREGTKGNYNIVSRFRPVNETSQDSSRKCKRNFRRILHSRTDRSMSLGVFSRSVASNEKAQLKHLAWTNCNAAVESRETTVSKNASEESDSNKTLQAETSQDGQASNDVSTYKSCNTEMLNETHTDSLGYHWPPSVFNQDNS